MTVLVDNAWYTMMIGSILPISNRSASNKYWKKLPIEIKRDLATRRLRTQVGKPARVMDIEFDYIIEKRLGFSSLHNKGY